MTRRSARSAAAPLLAAALLALSSTDVAAQAPDGAAAEAAATITAEDILDRIGVLAHDSMRGRDTPSPELEEVAQWIAGEFETFGLEPGGDDGTWLQRYPILRLRVDLDGSTVASSEGANLAFGEDVVPARFGSTADVEVEGPAVLIRGAGEPGRAVESADLAGAVVILVPPAGVDEIRDPELLPLVRAVLAREPAALLLASEAPGEAWESRVREARERASTVLGEVPGEGRVMLRVRDGSLARILRPAGVDVADLRAGDATISVRPLAGLTLSVRQAVETVSEASAPNVVGILRGSDPELRDQYLVYSAHMDHVGVGRPVEGDSIYNGADDDASGTAMVVELAEAMASLPTAPRRSVVFLLVSGEEKGLWGSGWFADHPPVPAERMVANLNADMVGRNWSDTIVAIGKEHSDLGETLERVNAAHPDLNMNAIDDRWPEQNFYRRSDHFNFARKGVPVLFFFNGTHEDYHRPSDHVEKIDGDKTARIGRLLFWLGLEVANADQPPQWNPESYREIVGGGGQEG